MARASLPAHDVADLALAPEGAGADRVGGRADAGAGADPGAVRGRAAAGGHPDRRLPACHRRDGEPGPHAGRRRGDGRRCARPIRSPLRTMSPRRSCSRTASRCGPGAVRTSTRTSSMCWRCSRHTPQITLDDGADLLDDRARPRRRDARGADRRNRGDHDRPRPPAPPRGRGRACAVRSWPSTRRAPSGRSTTATAPASRRSTGSFAPRNVLLAGNTIVVVGLRLGGPGGGRARPGRRGRGDRVRGRPAPRAGGADGRLRGDDRRCRRPSAATSSSPSPARGGCCGASTSSG